MKRTTQTKSIYEIKRLNQTIDADKKSVGRISTEIARFLMGKHKTSYTPQVDQGDFVTVLNASKMSWTGKKLLQKKFYTHSQYPGGLKTKQIKDLFPENAAVIIRHAVYKMIPKNKFRDRIMKRLTVKN